MARIAEHVFLVRAGREKSVAATKTYTGQMLMMYLLAYALGGGVRIADLERIPEVVGAALALEPEIDALSERYRFMRHAVVVGRGLNYSNAFELALKLMETCYVVAERFSSADFLHGPIALVEQNFPVFAFAPSGQDVAFDRRDAHQAAGLAGRDRRHHRLGQPRGGSARNQVIRLPRRVKEILTPIPYVVPAQIFAACLAAHKGLDPDKPRTLTKVTLTLVDAPSSRRLRGPSRVD